MRRHSLTGAHSFLPLAPARAQPQIHCPKQGCCLLACLLARACLCLRVARQEHVVERFVERLVELVASAPYTWTTDGMGAGASTRRSSRSEAKTQQLVLQLQRQTNCMFDIASWTRGGLLRVYAWVGWATRDRLDRLAAVGSMCEPMIRDAVVRLNQRYWMAVIVVDGDDAT